MTLPTVLSQTTELKAEPLMWSPTPLEINRKLECGINSHHAAVMVEHVIPGWPKDSSYRIAIICCDPAYRNTVW